MRVLGVIEECHAEGYLNDEERELAESQVRMSVDQQGLDVVLARLPDRQRDGSDKGARRATEAERRDAVRRLKMYVSQGAIEPKDGENRIAQVEKSKTPHDISEAFYDLGPLDGDRPERRVSQQQRDEAIRQLTVHGEEGRITPEEHRRAVGQVRHARNQTEINAAFRGLRSPRVTAASEKTKKAGELARSAAGEGGRRAKHAVMRLTLAVAALVIAIPVAIIGGGAVGAAVCVIIAIGLGLAAIRTLVVG
jgi:DUF1707 SHOCT-like domain